MATLQKVKEGQSLGFPVFLGSMLVISVLLVAAFLLRGECPNCRGACYANYGVDEWWTKRHGLPTADKAAVSLMVPCTRCSGTGKIPLIWTWIEIPSNDEYKGSLLSHPSEAARIGIR